MKVALINTTLLNGGDAAINAGTMRILANAFGPETTEFVCYDAHRSAAESYYPELDLREPLFDRIERKVPGRWSRKAVLIYLLVVAKLFHRKRNKIYFNIFKFEKDIIESYSEADVVVSAGGTYLVNNYRIAPKLYEFLLVLAVGRPLVLFTQSIGPIGKLRDRLLLRFILRRATLVMVRDERSRREVLSLGGRADRVVRCPDAAFALAEPEAAPLSVLSNPSRVAVSVRDWPFFAAGDEDGMGRYLDAVADFVRSAVEIDCASVTLISSCQGVRDYWTDDSRIAELVLQRLPPHVRANVELDSRYRRPAELIDRLRDFDCVVATRMHMAILALCARVPVVPIAYEFKTRELFAGLGFNVPVSDIASVSGSVLYRAWRGLLDSGASEESAGWTSVDASREQAFDCGGLVAKALIAQGDYG